MSDDTANDVYIGNIESNRHMLSISSENGTINPNRCDIVREMRQFICRECWNELRLRSLTPLDHASTMDSPMLTSDGSKSLRIMGNHRDRIRCGSTGEDDMGGADACDRGRRISALR